MHDCTVFVKKGTFVVQWLNRCVPFFPFIIVSVFLLGGRVIYFRIFEQRIHCIPTLLVAISKKRFLDRANGRLVTFFAILDIIVESHQFLADLGVEDV